jgi:hypothetical protein
MDATGTMRNLQSECRMMGALIFRDKKENAK